MRPYGFAIPSSLEIDVDSQVFQLADPVRRSPTRCLCDYFQSADSGKSRVSERWWGGRHAELVKTVSVLRPFNFNRNPSHILTHSFPLSGGCTRPATRPKMKQRTRLCHSLTSARKSGLTGHILALFQQDNHKSAPWLQASSVEVGGEDVRIG